MHTDIPHATNASPLHIVSNDGAPPTPPTTRLPVPSPAPAGDRNAADLRAHLQGAGWADKPDVCLRASRWQQANSLDDVTAAKTIGLPHILPEMFKRFRECRRPIGVGHHWPELQALTIESAAQTRFSAMVASREHADAVPPPPPPARVVPSPVITPTPTPTAKPTVKNNGKVPEEIRDLARVIDREAKVTAEHKSNRTIETAHRIEDMVTRLHVKRGTFAGMLATAAGESGKDPVNKWTARLYAYAAMLLGDKPTTTTTTTTAATTTSTRTSILSQMYAAIAREMRLPGIRPTARTRETALLVRNAAASLASPGQLTRTYKTGFAGANALGNALAQLDANSRGEAPDDKLRSKWVSRVEEYRSLITAAPATAAAPSAPKSASTPPPVKVSPAQALAPTPATSIAGRPTLLADGRLRVKVTQVIDVSPGDALWASAMAAVNATA